MSANKTVLITGGNGYIGSHAALTLRESGYSPVVVDDLSRSDRHIADVLSGEPLGIPVHEGKIEDSDFMDYILSMHKPSAVMHFAALAYVGESVSNPSLYYRQNVSGTVSLLDSLLKHNVKNFIFSSTCATYGAVSRVPISESESQNPVNPYGWSKFMIEQILKDYSLAYDLRFVIFRYFNAAGAEPLGRIGEFHEPETHLIPLAIQSALGNGELSIFGDDYDTPDGTCIRDYIHVMDIANAHLLGLEYLTNGGSNDFFNIGNGSGYSILEVINTVKATSGRDVAARIVNRRPGDPPALVANSEKVRRVLGWEPAFPKLEDIVATAWRWHTKL